MCAAVALLGKPTIPLRLSYELLTQIDEKKLLESESDTQKVCVWRRLIKQFICYVRAISHVRDGA